MEAVASINARIMQIQSQIAQLNPPRPVPAMVGTVAGPSSASGLSRASGTAGVGRPGGTAMAFQAAMDQAAGTAPTAGVGSGKSLLNANGVPLELLAHGNGKVPPSALTTVAGTNHKLWTPAARSLEALRAAAARDGVTIGVTDSYRTYESQVDLAERKGLYNQGGLAAVPGTSKHGWGMATDLDLDAKAQAWMRANAGDYGFVEDTPREPWHWGYHPTH